VTLRELGVFAPLREGHPDIGTKCWICGREIREGTRVSLKPKQTAEETGSMTVEAAVVCATCKLRGETIMTPVGPRIVQDVLDGDVKKPVVVTNGEAYADSEVGPV